MCLRVLELVLLSPGQTEGLLSGGISANGATTITVGSSEGSTTLDGFFNADASLGMFALRWEPTEGDPDELGLVILTETN